MRVIFKHEDEIDDPDALSDSVSVGPIVIDGWVTLPQAKAIAFLIAAQLEEQ